MLSGSAKLFVDCELKPKSYLELKSGIISEFAEEISSADIHRQLQERKKISGENYREYIYSLIEIANQGEVEDSAIIDYAIAGIRDSETNKQILYEAKTLKDLKAKLKTYEKMKDRQKIKQGLETWVKSNRMTTKDRSERNCFNCGGKNHEFHSCPEKWRGPKCFKCGIFGHRSFDCGKNLKDQGGTESRVHLMVKNKMCKVVSICGVEVEALVDTGSDLTLVKEEVVAHLRSSIIMHQQISIS